MRQAHRSFCIAVAALALLFASCSGAKNQLKNLEDGWWRGSAVYHVWIKGFADSDGDGCGDINGIRRHLDYIKATGCDTIWLSPFFECASKGTATDYNMHGYDVTDYYAVNSLFGTKEQLQSLIAECHAQELKILFDFVPNHTSSEHPWFKDSAQGKNDRRDWYVWSDSGQGKNPMGSGPAWYYNEQAGKWYYAPFWDGMPDLNYTNPAVQKEMQKAAFYWLDMGFDGMRVDAARYLIEDGSRTADSDPTHQWFSDLHQSIKKRYKGSKVMLGEVWVERRRDILERYFGTDGDAEFDMVTDFDSGRAMLRCVVIGASAMPDAPYENPHGGLPSAYAAFLANHDEYQNRIGSVLGTDWQRISQALALSVLRPPVPIVYYGQELGMADLPLDGDIRHRGPMDWHQAVLQQGTHDSPLGVLHDTLSLRLGMGRFFADATVQELSPNRGQCYAYVLHDATGQDRGDVLCVYNFAAFTFEEYIFYKTESHAQWGTAQVLYCTPGAEGATLTLQDGTVTAHDLPANSVLVVALR